MTVYGGKQRNKRLEAMALVFILRMRPVSRVCGLRVSSPQRSRDGRGRSPDLAEGRGAVVRASRFAARLAPPSGATLRERLRWLSCSGRKKLFGGRASPVSESD